MISLEGLNRFLDESNAVIKSAGKLNNVVKCTPLCSFRIGSEGNSILFGIEARGCMNNEPVFCLVAQQEGDDASKFISHGIFTASGHCTSFKMSHDEPCGMSIQQGVLIEMKNIVYRMNKDGKSQFLANVLEQLNGVKVKISVVKLDDVACSSNNSDTASLGKLRTSGEQPSDEQIKKRIDNTCHPEPVEDIIDQTFVKTIGNKNEKPTNGNEIDDALKDTQVYQIEKQTFGQRIVATFRKMLGFDREREKLDRICEELFDEKEND